MIQKRQQKEIQEKEMVEKKASIRQLEELLKIIQEPLNSLGDAAPPSAFDEPEVVERSVCHFWLFLCLIHVQLEMPCFSIMQTRCPQ